LVLNGRPRHVGQACLLDGRLRVDHVVWLECLADVVVERIRRDTGGDRAGRSDDDLASVRRRLDTYLARTAPLAAHYEARGARLHRLPVTADSSAAAAMDRLPLWGRMGGSKS
jgi:adenylate kinase